MKKMKKNKKSTKERKRGITRPRPDGGLIITRKVPGALHPAVVVPCLGRKIYNGHPKIRALTCIAKDATTICLAERKLEVWGK